MAKTTPMPTAGTKQCAACGTEFQPVRRTSRCCSAPCRVKLNRAEQNAKHYVKHPDRPCPVCQQNFTPKRSDSVCCSQKCRRRYHYQYTPKDNTRTCPLCNETFKPTRSDAVYCSPRCTTRTRRFKATGRAAYLRRCGDCGTDIADEHGNARFCPPCRAARPAVWEARRTREKRCAHCHAEFTAKTGKEKHCSSRCSGLASRRKQLAAMWAMACVVCSEPFETADTRKLTCSTRCRLWRRRHPGAVDIARWCATCGGPIDKADHRAKTYCSERCSRLTSKSRRRVAITGKPVERVSLLEIFDRDDWTCHLCSGPIDPNLERSHPQGASIDHIIPVSDAAYPGHVWENLAAAHLRCNTSKNARVTQHDWALYRELLAQRSKEEQWPPKRPAPQQPQQLAVF